MSCAAAVECNCPVRRRDPQVADRLVDAFSALPSAWQAIILDQMEHLAATKDLNEMLRPEDLEKVSGTSPFAQSFFKTRS